MRVLKNLWLVWQGESSTGAHQSLAGVADACHAQGALLIVDTVCSLGAVPFYGDAWGIDCMYSGSQKVISAPPGVQNACVCSALVHLQQQDCRHGRTGMLMMLFMLFKELPPSC